VLHIAGLGFDGLVGYSPIRMAKNAIGLGLALEAFGSRFFSNDAKSGGFLEHPNKLSPDAHKRITESMQSQGGLDNAHRMKILEEGMKYHAVTIAPEDSQFLASRTFSVEEIARLYRVPLHLLQSQSKTTSWGSGIAQMTLGFLQHTLAPWLARWEQALTARLFTEEERRAGYSVRHNVNALLRADPVQRAQFYTAALNPSTGWMSRNEVRALEDLNPDDVENAATAQPPALPPQQEPRERPEPEEDDE
jgi:HK97 family phage portal protein